MQDVMGVINLSSTSDTLRELTYFRTQASVPFGGRYRLIDFTLSNMVNSGVKDVAILTSNKYRSLMEHLGTGRDWDLDRKRGGLFILPPNYDYPTGDYLGDLQSFYQHLDFLIKGHQKYVLIASGRIVSNVDFRPVLHYHKQKGADITLLYKERKAAKEITNREFIKVNGNERVTEFTDSIYSNKEYVEVMIMEKDLLLNIINQCVHHYHCDLLKDGIKKNLHRLKIYGYAYQGYVASIDSVQSYYRHSMDLLKEDVWRELFYQRNAIYTKVKNNPPVKYSEESQVSNSFIANGCEIEGKVENSIIFRGVKIKKGAYIKNSIIMQNSEIGESSFLDHAILDKKARVLSNQQIIGEGEIPYIVAKRMTV